MTHTPGPWSRTNLTIHTQATSECPALRIARVYEAGIETEAAKDPHQATANANLMMSAPDLLATLEIIEVELADRYDGAEDSPTKWMGYLLTRIEEAIRKAKRL